MDVPNLVMEKLDGEEIVSTVNLGDEDIVCVTPTRTLVYRGEGLLSDESVSAFPHDVERFDVSKGRRKTKFVFEYVDRTVSFTVPGSRSEPLLSLLFQGMLRVADVIDDDESVADVFQFSELTLVVTDARLVKHVGEPVWDADYEIFDYDDVSNLAFEKGSVATQVILTVSGRPQRIKAPNDDAPQVEQTLTQALCAYYDVGSLSALNDHLAEDEEDNEADEETTTPGGFELDDGISPLVDETGEADEGDDADEGSRDPLDDTDATSPSASGEEPVESEASAVDSERSTVESGAASNPLDDAGTERSDAVGARSERETETDRTASEAVDSTDRSAASSGAIDPADIEAIESRLATLTEAVERQNELLRRHDATLDEHSETIAAHDETIVQLIEELRRGR